MQKIYKKLSIAIILLLAASNIATAQWQTNGPYGGRIYSSVTAAGKIFIGTDNGVFSSIDNGTTWVAANTGMERIPIVALTTDGTNLFAGAEADGVFFSSNGGATWLARNTGLSNLFINSIFVSSNGIYAATAYGEFYSNNSGTSWMLRNTGIPASYTIHSHTEMGDTVFAGSYLVGLFETYDDGAHWNHISGNGFPDSAFVYTLCTTGNTIYAATNTGIYKSGNRGVSWVSSNIGFPANTTATALAVKPGYVFAGTDAGGIFVSTDNAASWNSSNNGLAQVPHYVDTINVFPSVGALLISGSGLIASTLDGVYSSANNGTSWTESNQGISGTDVTGISATGAVTIIGTAKNGVYLSTDNGSTWNRGNAGLTTPDINSILINGSNTYLSAGYQHVFRSGDGGITWVPASTGITSEVTELKADSTNVFALTNGAPAAVPGLFETTDSGATWTELPTGFTESMNMLSVAGTKLYIGTWDGSIYYSNDHALTWTNIGSTLPDVKINSVLISGADLYAATEGSGIYKSSNNGATWNLVNTGISNLYVNDIQEKDGYLYAVTWGGGAFVSNTAGASWATYNGGLNDLYVNKICTDGSTALYAATDAGVYKAPLVILNIAGYELENVNVYPNPAAGVLHVTLPDNQKVIITLYNVSGDVVYSYEGAVSDRYDIDLSNAAKGIYVLDLQTEKGTAKKKVIVQ
ncbi:MAG: hypothetical protein JWP12_558 [Bacteroidetes bacterium]|nr:hypothetical protein [Bacteroidota bacterium]